MKKLCFINVAYTYVRVCVCVWVCVCMGVCVFVWQNYYPSRLICTSGSRHLYAAADQRPFSMSSSLAPSPLAPSPFLSPRTTSSVSPTNSSLLSIRMCMCVRQAFFMSTSLSSTYAPHAPPVPVPVCMCVCVCVCASMSLSLWVCVCVCVRPSRVCPYKISAPLHLYVRV